MSELNDHDKQEPKTDEDDNVIELSKRKEAEPAETDYSVSRVNAIIIDDSEISRNKITNILEEGGHNVLGSASKPSAIRDLLKQSGINLIIVDMALPEASGTQIIKQLKENLKKVYFLVVSNLDEEHLKIESISVGALDYLVKPFTENQLLGSIDNINKLIHDEG